MTCSFLYFDLGNVLLSFCHERMCRQMAAVAGLDPAAVKHAMIEAEGSLDMQMRFERGAIDARCYYDFFCEQTGTRPDRTALEYAGSDIFEVIEPMARLVESLAAAGHRLGILSNVGSVHWQFVNDGRYPFLHSAFELTVLSYEVHSTKPDTAIYRHAIDRAGVPAEEIFFVDDRHENVAGATAAGIDAVQFTSSEQLAQELRLRGIDC